MRSELNTEQRRVGLRPPAGREQRPLTQTCPVTMAAFHASQRSALAQRDKGVPSPSTPPPRPPVPEKLPPSPDDDVDTAAPAHSHPPSLLPEPGRANGGSRCAPAATCPARISLETDNHRARARSARAVIDRRATGPMRNTWTRRQAVGGSYMSSVARAGATCEHRAGGPARGAPV